jgi:hypothetical protein
MLGTDLERGSHIDYFEILSWHSSEQNEEALSELSVITLRGWLVSTEGASSATRWRTSVNEIIPKKADEGWSSSSGPRTASEEDDKKRSQSSAGENANGGRTY